ncbi:MAG: hypothetical protein HXX10_24815 [Rhodoplanes sp.]|uniref:hypothetical protein n=1 Tax=Rhodoplanes sp. TaxID=1968906 RepID=UPI001818EDAF|nr:hypothetical protein [Rhodoplanes sp.]NVO17261.1 hypothetical protein [Rhodoplanes sp.]
MAESGKAQERAAREQRLSAALRENLRRRKAQSRARTVPAAGASPDAAMSPERPAESHDSAGFLDENQPG